MTVVVGEGVREIDAFQTGPERKPFTRAAVVVIFNEDFSKVVLFRHGPESRIKEGVYGLPGGRVKGDETEIQAAAREAREETGLGISIATLADLPSNQYYGDVPLKDGKSDPSKWRAYLATSFSGELREANGEGQPLWVPIEELDRKKVSKEFPLHLNTKDIVLRTRDFCLKHRI